MALEGLLDFIKILKRMDGFWVWLQIVGDMSRQSVCGLVMVR